MSLGAGRDRSHDEAKCMEGLLIEETIAPTMAPEANGGLASVDRPVRKPRKGHA